MKRWLWPVVILAVVITGIAWRVTENNLAKAWPSIQLKRATALGSALADHQEQHGEFPDSLDRLMSSGILSAERYDELKFQKHPRAERQEWIYSKPKSLHESAIISPDPVFPWQGSSGQFITAMADGGGQNISATKAESLRKLLD